MSLKVLHVVGARPQFIKLAPVLVATRGHSRECPDFLVEDVLVHTGQHYDYEMSQVFFGEVYYIHSQRLNFGIVRTEENALWSLGPHDISVILYLIGKEPMYVLAYGVHGR